MKYVFGPVPSKRLGQSLGVDTIPLKTCNWNCIYCQLGRTVPLVNKRSEYYPRQEILAEINQALKSLSREEVDWITFVGSGEPTLHAGIGWLIYQVKAEVSDIPVAVITNGSLLSLREVRDELAVADVVLPSLDAGNSKLFRQVNRPYSRLSYKRHVEGLVAFRKEFAGKLWIEVMLVHGMNDSQECLLEIALVLNRIEPDQVHINSPTRPPVETWVQPADVESITRTKEILGDKAIVVSPAEGSFQLEKSTAVEDAIIGIISRHPMSEEELLSTLKGYPHPLVNNTLQALQVSGRVKVINRHGTCYWVAFPAHFPEPGQSRMVSPDRLSKFANDGRPL